MNPPDSILPCSGPLPETVLLGLACFNAGRYFEAHEYLESAWRAEKSAIRELYQGILQVGVGYYHLQRGNLAGAQKLLDRARGSLIKFGDRPCGIDIAGLLVDVERVEAALRKPERLPQHLEAGLLRPIRFNP